MREILSIRAREAVRRAGREASTLCARMRGCAWRDDRGAIAVALAVALPALAGLAFLAVDAGRYYNLHTSLQSAADAFALAAAAELDRRPDSVTRAERAVAELLENDHRFGSGDARLTAADISVRYFEEAPGGGVQPIDPADNPEDARYAEVRVDPVALSNPTIATILGMAGPFEARAESVGGFEQGVCEFAPFFICNPYEDSTETSLFEAVKDRSWRRRLIALRAQGGTSSHWGPGNYGFLASPNGQGAKELREMLAVDRPQACFVQSGVELRPGYVASANEALNVRFDIYEGSMNSARSDERYRPAKNVRKGYKGKNCGQQEPGDPEYIRGLPRDDCYDNGTCEELAPEGGGRMGGGNWDLEGYWETNYKTSPPGTINGHDWSSSDLPTRYDVYLEELESPANLYMHEAGQGSDQETGAPICYSGPKSALEDELDRRVLNAAIINCNEYADRLSGSSGEPIPVEAFGRMFLTEPVGASSDQTVWAELIGLIEPGVPGAREILRDIVQLHR